MSQPKIYQKIKGAVDLIQERTASHPTLKPKLGVVLGSGLGSIADEVQDRVELSYAEIPHFHGTSVEGHAGKMVLGFFKGTPCVFLQGRFHLYEGYPIEDVVFPTRVICALGIQTLVLTNAAGGVNTSLRPKDLMIITDHINLMGDNPLKGPDLKELGPRFPDLTEAYNRELVAILKSAVQKVGVQPKEGVYAGLLGPTYETPAEVRMLRTLGADAVGMSTVPEAIAANHLGVQVAGVCSITNLAAGITPQKLTHEEVIENSKVSAENLKKVFDIALPQMVRQPAS